MTKRTEQIIQGDCLKKLRKIPDASIRMVFVDPPFGTNKTQTSKRVKAVRSAEGHEGFGGNKYRRDEQEAVGSYEDTFDDFEGFLMPRLEAALPKLTDDGSLFVLLDQRNLHHIKVALDKLMGRDHFMGEILWLFEWGAKSRKKWPCKHNTILWYVKDPKNYVFDYEAVERIPYMSPEIVGAEKAEKGKTLSASWWLGIIGTNSKERTGYPTQKPLKLVERFIKVHTNKNDTVLDFFAGSGTTGQAAKNNKRGYVLIDSNPEAIKVMQERLGHE